MYSVATFGEVADANRPNAADAGSGISGHTTAVPAVEHSPNPTVQAASPAAVPTPSPQTTDPPPHPHRQGLASTPGGPGDDAIKAEPADGTTAAASGAAVGAPTKMGKPGMLTEDGSERQMDQGHRPAGAAVPAMCPANEQSSLGSLAHPGAGQGVREGGDGLLASEQPPVAPQAHHEQDGHAAGTELDGLPGQGQASMMPLPGSATGTSAIHQAAAVPAQMDGCFPGSPVARPAIAAPSQQAASLCTDQHADTAVPSMSVVQDPAVLGGNSLVPGLPQSAQPSTGLQQQQQPGAASSSAPMVPDPEATATQPTPRPHHQESPVSAAAASLWQEAKAATLSRSSRPSPASVSQAHAVPEVESQAGMLPLPQPGASSENGAAGMLPFPGMHDTGPHGDVGDLPHHQHGSAQPADANSSMPREGYQEFHAPQTQAASPAVPGDVAAHPDATTVPSISMPGPAVAAALEAPASQSLPASQVQIASSIFCVDTWGPTSIHLPIIRL